MQKASIASGATATGPDEVQPQQPVRAAGTAKLRGCILLRRRNSDLQLKLVRLPLDVLDISSAQPLNSTALAWPSEAAYIDAIAAANMPVVRPKAATGRYAVISNSQTVAWLRGLDPFVIGQPAIIYCLVVLNEATASDRTPPSDSFPGSLSNRAWKVVDQWLGDFALGRLGPDVATRAASLLKASPLGTAKAFSLRERLNVLLRP